MPSAIINGIQLHYDIHGEGAPVLFVHGLGSAGRDWEKQVAAFADRYRILTVDLRGHGRSQRPAGPYSIAGFADDLARLLRELKLPPVHLVGLSLGGMISLQLAADHAELIRSAAIVNSGPDIRPRRLSERLQLLLRRGLIHTFGLKRFGPILGRRLFPANANLADRKAFETRFVDNDKAPYLAALDAAMSTDLTPRLADIHCPVLVVAADQDYWPVSAKQAYVDKMPTARLVVVPDSHHALPVEKPEAFNAVLREFLDAQR